MNKTINGGDSMQYKNFQEAVENIEWNLLEQQKNTLEQLLVLAIDLKTSDIPDKNLTDLWGLIEFIEIMQDLHDNKMSYIRNDYVKKRRFVILENISQDNSGCFKK
jgi:hypothetical protein